VPEQSLRLCWSRQKLLLLFLILIAGTAFRFASLPHEALEGDELFSRRVVLLSLAPELEAIRTDLVHPPLYYLLMQGTTKVWGAGAVGVRLFSLLCGIASIPLIALLGCTLPGSRYAGLLAAALLALNQTHIFYSQEARSYAWYALLVMLLYLWVWRITDASAKAPSMKDWVAGTILMTALVYTHYVGAIYVACAVAAVWLSGTAVSRRIASLECAAIAAVCFVPWIVAIAAVYKAKHGIGENLNWQGHPGFNSLSEIFSSAIGDLNVHGTAKFILLLLLLLITSAFFGKRQQPRQTSMVTTLLLLSVVPPILVFVLAREPLNLPIFGLRHCLPSIPLLILLCCYGVERLADRAGNRFWPVFGLGCAVLVVLAAIPSVGAVLSLPSRIPYDVVSKDVAQYRAQGIPSYAVWFYGVGEPVNFYCSGSCVSQMPMDHHQLPQQIIVLFRSASSGEKQQLEELEQEGYREVEEHYYTDGQHDPYGTMLIVLQRPAQQAVAVP
jgi:mannosyltransferase